MVGLPMFAFDRFPVGEDLGGAWPMYSALDSLLLRRLCGLRLDLDLGEDDVFSG